MNIPQNIIYSINKLDADTTFQFEYNPIIKNEALEYKLKNPYKVCDEYNDCDEYISSYKFRKGQSYKIYVNYEYKYWNYILPAYAFYSGSKKHNYFSNNHKFISLNIFSLIIYFVLFIKF